MTVKELADALEAEVLAGAGRLDGAVTGGYVSDLLSNVMAQAPGGGVWVTMQAHPNVVAVAALTGLTAVVIAGGVRPEDATVKKAAAEEVVLLATALSAFEAVGRLYSMGVRGL
ncbi:DRTGG domain-containing protein [Sporolituus thermophilus]|uniref:DRTGG domain-containing protein n=1 Tax=Sporolituus thermophilus DSM 23256 TaxID=1123285 RepID=A0A1G7J5W0_9FIRM|nr:DRTGG domain-containing protein [Sporolituus thermophilus]SDF20248.1 DRTGG domain-containing protein [Sporolituus thermophilus DSM 23256]